MANTPFKRSDSSFITVRTNSAKSSEYSLVAMSAHSQSDQSETPRLCFDSQQDALDFQAKLVQDSRDWMALNDLNFVDRYKRKEIEIVMPLCIRNNEWAESNDFHLVLSAVPSVRIWHGERSTVSPRRSSPSFHDGLHWPDDRVLVPVTQFVQCPQEVIASSVWLEPAKERLNLFRQVFGPSDGRRHVTHVTGEGESSVSGVRFTNCDGNGIPSNIQSTSQINNHVTRDVAKLFWERSDEFYLVNLPARCLRIGFDNLCVWFEVVELPDSPVEIGKEIFLSPCEFTARTGERVSHRKAAEYYGPMKSKLDTDTTPEQKLDRFHSALRGVLQVSKQDLNNRLAAEKIANEGKPKRGPKPRTSASGHASGGKG
jgi:hypothetical protein